MNTTAMLNELGQSFCKFNFTMLVQSSVLIVVLLLLDLVLRKRTRAIVRYFVWMLVLVKLVLPTTLCMPTGLGYWIGNLWLPEIRAVEQENSREEKILKNEVGRKKYEKKQITGIGDQGSGKVLAGARANNNELNTKGTERFNLVFDGESVEYSGGSAAIAGNNAGSVHTVSMQANANGSEPQNTEADGVAANTDRRLAAAGGTAANAASTSSEEASNRSFSNWADQSAIDKDISWQAWLFLGWTVGVLVLVTILVQRFWFVRSLVAQSEPISAERINDTLTECQKMIGLRRPIELRLTKNMMSPAACGLMNPVVLMPEELLAKLSKDKLRAVLLHELAHIKRGDLWVNLFQTLLQIMYFFNPLLWLANAIIRSIREKAVDEMVLTKMEGDASAYSSTLVDIAEIAFSRPHFSLRLVGVVESKKALTDRIRHILSRPFPRTAKLGTAGITSILILAAALLPMASGKNSANQYVFEYGDGQKIELVGVSDRSQPGNTWHSPDGKPLGIDIKTNDTIKTSSQYPEYYLAFKAGAEVKYKIDSVKGCNVKARIDTPNQKDMTVYKVFVKDKYDETKVTVAVLDGNWQTRCTMGYATGSTTNKVDGKPVVLSGTLSGNNLIITCSDNVGYKKASRIDVIDKNGNVVPGEIKVDTGYNNVRQRTIEYKNLDPDKVDKIAFMTCSYITHTFKKVRLKYEAGSMKDEEIQPDGKLVIKGTVSDIETGKPISGAIVGDSEKYNDGKFRTTTDEEGKFEYWTYYEEHFVVAKADGYEDRQEILLTKMFGKEESKEVNFQLKAEKNQGTVIRDQGSGKESPDGELINNSGAEDSREIDSRLKTVYLRSSDFKWINQRYTGEENYVYVLDLASGTVDEYVRISDLPQLYNVLQDTGRGNVFFYYKSDNDSYSYVLVGKARIAGESPDTKSIAHFLNPKDSPSIRVVTKENLCYQLNFKSFNEQRAVVEYKEIELDIPKEYEARSKQLAELFKAAGNNLSVKREKPDIQPAFLSREDIVGGWKDNYGSLENMEVQYEYHVTVKDKEKLSENNKNIVMNSYIQAIVELGSPRFVVAYSDDPQEDLNNLINNVLTMSYDNNKTWRYYPDDMLSVQPGITDHMEPTMAHIRPFLLLDTSQKAMNTKETRPDFLKHFENPKVIVEYQLDIIAGEQCHILSYRQSNERYKASYKVWVAHNKGMVPMKYIEYTSGNHEFEKEFVVEELGCIQSGKKAIWYPKVVITNPNNNVSKKYIFARFKPNVQLEEDTFKLHYKPKMLVIDKVNNRQYRIGDDINTIEWSSELREGESKIRLGNKTPEGEIINASSKENVAINPIIQTDRQILVTTRMIACDDIDLGLDEPYLNIIDKSEFPGIIRKTKASEKSRMITAPEIRIKDGEEGYLNMSKTITYVSNDGSRQQNEDADMGIRINLLPKILDDGSFRLELKQESSYLDVDSMDNSNVLSPLTGKTESNTTVIVGADQMLVMPYVPEAGKKAYVFVEMEVIEPKNNSTAANEQVDYEITKPFSIYGKVTDVDGNGMAGIELWASCGMGTLLPTGKTVSDNDGNYRLSFGPGMWHLDNNKRKISLQCATIHAGKSGYFEQNLCRHGNLGIAGNKEQAESNVWGKNAFEKILLPEEPYNVDFVMVKGASVDGTVKDATGKPLSDFRLHVKGDILYPSSSVLFSATTDQDGRFTLDSIPDKVYYFEHDGKKSKDIQFEPGGEYIIDLVYDGSKLKYEVRRMKDEEEKATDTLNLKGPALLVLDEDTKEPIEGCWFTLTGWGYSKLTNKEGVFDKNEDNFFMELSNRGRDLHLRHPEYNCLFLDKYTMDENKVVTVLLKKEGNAALDLTVKFILDGEEIKNEFSQIRLYRGHDNSISSYIRFDDSRTGKYSFGGLAAGKYTIMTSFSRNYEYYPQEYTKIEIREDEHNVVVINAERELSPHEARWKKQNIAPSVLVLDEVSKEAIANCSVSLGGWGHTVRTNAQGIYGLNDYRFHSNFITGMQRLILKHPDYEDLYTNNYNFDEKNVVTVYMRPKTQGAVKENNLKITKDTKKGSDPFNFDNSYVAEMPGDLIFHGKYRHIQRRREIDMPGELWIKQSKDSSIAAAAYLPWMNSYNIATGNSEGKLVNYKAFQEETSGEVKYSAELEIGDGKVMLTRNGIRGENDKTELAVPEGAYYNPTARPDSYCVDNIFMRGIDIKAGESKEFRCYDQDNSGKGMADYTIEITNTGIEEVTVPAGTFEASHYVLKQTSSANTWFKKRAGHVTDYWVLDSGIIVRILRHREPYEIQLLEYSCPSRLDGLIMPEGEGKYKKAEDTETILKGPYEIEGKVIAAPSQEDWEEYFSRLETANTQNELNEQIESIFSEKTPAAGVTVKLSGFAYGNVKIEKEIATNDNGYYNFVDLPDGNYNTSCKYELIYNRTGARNTVYADGGRGVQFGAYSGSAKKQSINLNLSDDYVTICGSVVDSEGNPIAGAAIAGTTAPVENGGVGETTEHTEAIKPQIIRSTTDQNGYYTLEGFKAGHVINTLRYLINTNKKARGAYKFFVDLEVTAPGYKIADGQQTRVPLIGQEQLYRARKLLKIYNIVANKHGEKQYDENTDQAYPPAKSVGSKLIDVDIAMEQGSGIGEQESGDENNSKLVNQRSKEEEISNRQFGPVDFDGFYLDSVEGGKALDELMADKDRDLRDADEIIATVRNGLRRYSGRENILRWIGNMFIWGKEPQNIKAIELMYHASDSKDFGTAVYFGLSVVKDMTPEIIAALGEVAMKTDDYYNQVGRINWGCKNRGKVDELVTYIKKYLNDDDPEKRKKAQDLIDYFADSKAFMAKRAEEHKKKLEEEYGDKLDEYKHKLLTGNSQQREDIFWVIRSNIYAILDDSFIDPLAACLEDESWEIRSEAAGTLGNKYIWGNKLQNERVIEMLTPLLDDESRDVRYSALYYGLSTVRNPNEELLEKTLKTILDDRESNYYGRVIWGAKRNRQACEKILMQWMDNGGEKGVKAYEIYEDVMEKRLPKEYAQRFAGQKSDVHQGVSAIIHWKEPIAKDKLQDMIARCVTDNNLAEKISDLFIIEKRESALGIIICENLADRNAVRDAFSKENLQTVGYMHGKISMVGSGWIENRDEYAEHYKDNRVDLSEMKNAGTTPDTMVLDGIGKIPVYKLPEPNSVKLHEVIAADSLANSDLEPLKLNNSKWTFRYEDYARDIFVGGPKNDSIDDDWRYYGPREDYEKYRNRMYDPEFQGKRMGITYEIDLNKK